MNVEFKFAIGQKVTLANGLTGRVTSAAVTRDSTLGYYVEYLSHQGEIREVYTPERELTAASDAPAAA